jgi:ABC-type sugar transport system ATPase subunit
VYTATDIHRHFGGVRALDGVNLEIRPGEVHALLGANGAGKSTLVKILAGAERPTEGSLSLEGREVAFSDLGEAADNGVAIVSQELNLFPDFDVLHNLFLLREPLRGGVLVNRAEMARRARPVLDAVGLGVPVGRRVGTLRLGEQQLVEIARALLYEPKILILDEPTSALQAEETQRLLGVVRDLRGRGVGIVYVSHFLEDVFSVADRITILRNGRVVANGVPRAELTIPEAVRRMLGDSAIERREAAADDATALTEAVSDEPLTLSGIAVEGALEPFDLEARPDEVVGLAGLDGSGYRSVLETIFGERRLSAGEIRLPNGKPAPRSMSSAVRSGVAFVPADRKRLGVMLDKTIYENVSTVRGGPLKRMGLFLRTPAMVERAEHWGRQLGIKMSSPRSRVDELSGGNQQKVVLAKWLEADPQVVLLDDPTRGVDVGAKVEVHAVIRQMAASGRVVLLASSDLEEMAEICDRVVVFFRGRASGELSGSDLTEHRLLEAINTGEVR